MKGIEFYHMSSEVVAGTKTMTRRICNLNIVENPHYDEEDHDSPEEFWVENGVIRKHLRYGSCKVDGPYKIGETYYVKEPWAAHLDYDHIRPTEINDGVNIEYLSERIKGYPLNSKWHCFPDLERGRYRHARHMPERFSRAKVKIIDIRVERLLDITKADAIAEGIVPLFSYADIHESKYRAELDLKPMPYKNYGWPKDGGYSSAAPRESFLSLWDSIHGEGAHRLNPWVFAITFQLL